MAAAAPPPMPLYSAIICGMSVMATRLPLHHAIREPMTMAAMMSLVVAHFLPGYRDAASVASGMPAPAQSMPLRAVTGELMRLRPRMKSQGREEVARVSISSRFAEHPGV